MRHSHVKLLLLVNFLLFVTVCLYIHGYPRRPKSVSDSLSSPEMVVSMVAGELNSGPLKEPPVLLTA